MANQDNSDETRLSTPYGDLSDEAFVQELRNHLRGRSWTLGHWLELERRHEDLLDGDVELREAVADEQRKLNESIREALEPLQKSVADQLEPLQEQLRDMAASFAEKFDFSAVLPRFDISRLLAPTYKTPEIESFSRSLRLALPEGVSDDRERVPAKDVLDDLTTQQAARLKHEAEVRRAHLETATAAVAQLSVMEDLRDAVVESSRRDLYDWLLLAFATVAALAAVAAVILALIQDG